MALLVLAYFKLMKKLFALLKLCVYNRALNVSTVEGVKSGFPKYILNGLKSFTTGESWYALANFKEMSEAEFECLPDWAKKIIARINVEPSVDLSHDYNEVPDEEETKESD